MKIFSLLDTNYKAFSDKVNNYLSKTLSRYSTQYGSNTVFGQILTVVGNAIQNVMLYIEDSLIEQNKYTAQRKRSIFGLASLAGYMPSYGKAASVSMKLSFLPVNVGEFNVLINDKATFTCTQNGLQYNLLLPQESILLNNVKDNSTKYLNAVQGRFETQTFISDGGQYYTIRLNFIGNMDTDYLTVKVNNQLWSYSPSLYDMTSDGLQYTYKASMNGGIDIVFGNDAHGRALKADDVINVGYLIHDGEMGNLNPQEETYFVFNDNLNDMDGNVYDGNTLFNVTFAETDPVLSGCNSETVEHVREMIGLNTRSLVLSTPESYKAFLGKFGFCGYSRTWADPNSMVVNSLIIKNFQNMIENGSDYFNLNESDFLLTDMQKESIYSCMESMGNQIIGVKYNIFDPELCKYAMYVYVSLKNKKSNKDLVESQIKQLVGNFFSNINSDIFIPKSDIIHLIKENIDTVDGVDVYFLSQKNEDALINNGYTKDTFVMNTLTGKYVKKTENIKIYGDNNPNLGLDTHGNIWLESDTQFPVIMGGWDYENESGDLVRVMNPITIIFED